MAADSTFVESLYLKHVEWKIKNFLDLPKYENYNIDSPCFSLYGASWFLRIYTYGRLVDKTYSWVSLYLYKKESALEYLIDCRMGIQNSSYAIIDAKHIAFQKTEVGNGRGKLIKRSHVEAFEKTLAPNGTVTIYCTARVVGQRCITSDAPTASETPATSTVNVETQTTSSDGVCTLIENLKNLYISQSCADVSIIVKGIEFFAHRNILTSRSTVFSSKLISNMELKKSGILEINDCDPLSFEDFLLFLYTGDLNIVSIRNASSLYATAEKYDLKDLKDECVRCIMSSNITVDSFCDVIHIASICNNTDVLEAATNYFFENAKDILVTSKWKTFSVEHSSLGDELFLKYVNKK